jgi:hypothetical protein
LCLTWEWTNSQHLKLAISAKTSFPSINRLSLSYLDAILTDDRANEASGIKFMLMLLPYLEIPNSKLWSSTMRDQFRVVKVKETCTVQDVKNEIMEINLRQYSNT